jgi:hypothetical protein
MIHVHSADIGLYVGFLVGFFIFVLQCAAAAIRAKDNPIKTRRAYLLHNWDVLLIRGALEAALFTVWAHYDLTAFIQSEFGYTLPFKVPVTPVTSFGFGYMADSLMNWATKWKKVPAVIRERIPDLDIVQKREQVELAEAQKQEKADLSGAQKQEKADLNEAQKQEKENQP